METGTKQKEFGTAPGALAGLFDPPKDNGERKNPYGTATALSLNVSSLDKEVKVLNNEKKEIEAYREVQHLKLTKLQHQILDAITEEKLEAASLPDLTRAYVLLKDKELVMNGKATAITGIVGYLLHLEREDIEQKEQELKGTVVDVPASDYSVGLVEETPFEEQEEQLPCL